MIKQIFWDHQWNISQNKIAPYAACMEKYEVKWTILFTYENGRIINFLLKKPSATKHSPLSNVYYMEIYRNFLFEYSLMGILKPKFTRRNEIWCRLLEKQDLSKNVRKTHAGSNVLKSHSIKRLAYVSLSFASRAVCLAEIFFQRLPAFYIK